MRAGPPPSAADGTLKIAPGTMVIVCPNCSVSYHIEPHSLGSRGRTVRCAQCRHSWHVPGTEQILEEDDATAAESVAESFEPAGFSAATDAPADEGSEVPAEPSPATAGGNETVEDVETAAKREFPPRRRVVRARRPSAGTRRKLQLPRLVTVIACGGLLAFGAAVVWRDMVVTHVPETAALYRAIGFSANPRGLEFSNLATTEIIESGVPLLIVTGSIQNVAENTANVPRLRMSVYGSTGREIYVWTAMPSRAQLLPGETLSFWTQLASPPAEGREVSVRFLNRRDIAMGMTHRVDP